MIDNLVVGAELNQNTSNYSTFCSCRPNFVVQFDEIIRSRSLNAASFLNKYNIRRIDTALEFENKHFSFHVLAQSFRCNILRKQNNHFVSAIDLLHISGSRFFPPQTHNKNARYFPLIRCRINKSISSIQCVFGGPIYLIISFIWCKNCNFALAST